MSTFLSGAAVDCGPSNVLKNVGSRLDRDYSMHQDRLVSTPNTAGPSSQPFRQTGQSSRPPSQVAQPQRGGGPFDLSALRQQLSPPAASSQAQHRIVAAPNTQDWARAFLPTARAAPVQQQRPSGQVAPSAWHAEYQARPPAQAPQVPVSQARAPPWQTPYAPQFQRGGSMAYEPFRPSYQAPPQLPQTYLPQPAFAHQTYQDPSMDQVLPQATEAAVQRPAEPISGPSDLLAQTARDLVNEANSGDIYAANPGLRESKFMALMQKLGRGDIVVEESTTQNGVDEAVGEGAKFVSRPATDWAQQFHSSPSSSQPFQTEASTQMSSTPQRPAYPELSIYPAFPPEIYHHTEAAFVPSTSANATSSAGMQRRKSVHFEDDSMTSRGGVPRTLEEAFASAASIPGSQSNWEETLNDDEFGEEAFAHFNGEMRSAGDAAHGSVGAAQGWDGMQREWEDFLHGPEGAGVQSADDAGRYLFQSRNPYGSAVEALEDERMDGAGSPTLKGVLELEAAVQADPSNHDAWFALGLKQQENEREDAAIAALSKVIQLDRQYRPAYLAMAVSYTNEGNFGAATTMLERWIALGHGQAIEDTAADRGAATATGSRLVERQSRVIDSLIDKARESPEDVDADIQVALGVVFNSTEEYDKAEDCFLAAASVRPDDWLLYNRLGATLANSGRSNEAIGYYHKALSLHPNFVRALFNLGISYINLGQYRLAAQRVLDALRLQHADATEGYASGSGVSTKGITSDTLWNTLRSACMHMGEPDLVDLASRRNLTDLIGPSSSSDSSSTVQA